jgi:hypothetical protein
VKIGNLVREVALENYVTLALLGSRQHCLCVPPVGRHAGHSGSDLMNVRARRITLALAAVSFSTAASAIIIRHDVDDIHYRQLGEKYRLSVVDVAVPGRSNEPLHGNGAGTVIAPQWVLTAAHVATSLLPHTAQETPGKTRVVYFESRPYPIERVIVHPDWAGSQRDADIALVKVARRLEGADPVCLYPAGDEVDKVTTLVGRGYFGNGAIGPAPRQIGTLRGSTVKIDSVAYDGKVLVWDFNAPGQPGATALEGISGPGDSGGPAFLMHDGKLCVAGVSSDQDRKDLGEGRYGVTEFYPRVSYFRSWIEQVMRSNL